MMPSRPIVDIGYTGPGREVIHILLVVGESLRPGSYVAQEDRFVEPTLLHVVHLPALANTTLSSRNKHQIRQLDLAQESEPGY